MEINDRESWLTDLGQYLMDDILAPITTEYHLLKPPVKFSVSFAPSTRPGSSTLGCCSSRRVSAGGYNEIFISPELDGDASLQIMDIVLHELIHAYLDNKDGHRGRFKAIALKAGLVGRMTSTQASQSLKRVLEGYLAIMGPIPHRALDYAAMKKPSTSGKVYKITCVGFGCEFSFRTSAKHYNAMTSNTCLACGCDTLKEDN